VLLDHVLDFIERAIARRRNTGYGMPDMAAAVGLNGVLSTPTSEANAALLVKKLNCFFRLLAYPLLLDVIERAGVNDAEVDAVEEEKPDASPSVKRARSI
jgi:hypothetical protein